jgi:hypothetical protein
MAKKVAASSGGTIISRHNKSGQTYGGGNALKSDHSIANDGKGAPSGTQYARHMTTKPSSNSGTIGSGQPLKMNSGGKELRGSDAPKGGRVHKSTKPKR